MTTSTGNLRGFDLGLLIVSDETIGEIRIIQLFTKLNIDVIAYSLMDFDSRDTRK
jgi:hypothetical protein